jgi:hypothetical protein
MAGWDGYPVRDRLQQLLGRPVWVDNEVNLMALGEVRSGRARGCSDVVYVKLGPSVGGGLVLGGRLQHGKAAAGEIGHLVVPHDEPRPCWCGGRGCLDTFVNDTVLLAEARGVHASVADLTRSATAGDQEAQAVLRETGAATLPEVDLAGFANRTGTSTATALPSPSGVSSVRNNHRAILQTSFEIDLWALPVQRPTNPNGQLMAQLIQQDWAKIGVKASIKTFEWGEYLKRANNGEHNVYMSGWSGETGDADDFLTPNLSCAANKSGVKFCNAEFEKLIDEARATPDQKKRIALYEKAQEIFKHERPWITMAHSTVYIPIRKDVVGFKMAPNGSVNFEGVYRK